MKNSNEKQMVAQWLQNNKPTKVKASTPHGMHNRVTFKADSAFTVREHFTRA